MRQVILYGLVLAATGFLAACGRQADQQQTSSGQTSTEATPSTGKRPAAFSQCMMCHSDVQGRSAVGPSLFGVIGRKAGTLPGYGYSPAMKAADLTWDEATIDRFVQDPRAVVPGTKMSFAGLKSPQQRADVIHYIATLH